MPSYSTKNIIQATLIGVYVKSDAIDTAMSTLESILTSDAENSLAISTGIFQLLRSNIPHDKKVKLLEDLQTKYSKVPFLKVMKK